MISIELSKEQIDDLVDEVWQDGYSKPYIGQIYGLRKLRAMLTMAIDQTKNFPSKMRSNKSNHFLDSPPKSLSQILNGILNEVDRVWGIIEDWAHPDDDKNEEIDESELLNEMAENLEAWFTELDRIDNFEFSDPQLQDIDSICIALNSEKSDVLEALSGRYNYSDELGEK